MSIFRRIQTIRALVTALFVAAQLVGVVPLLCDHTKEVYENSLSVAATHSEVTSVSAAPDMGDPDSDLHDDCCALHSLAGPLPHEAAITASYVVNTHVLSKTASPPFECYPRVPERPPKHTPSCDRTQA
jgi:hypothetical protein